MPAETPVASSPPGLRPAQIVESRVSSVSPGLTAGKTTELPRVLPVSVHQQVGEVAELLGVHTGDGAVLRHQSGHPPLNALATVVRNPALYRVLVPQVRYLANGMLSERDRELALLRVASRVPCPYEWAQHCPAAREAGITDHEIARVERDVLDHDWDGHELTVLTAVDQLVATANITDETWQQLALRYTEAELIEFVVLVGEYQKLALLLNTLRTPIDQWLSADASAADVPPG